MEKSLRKTGHKIKSRERLPQEAAESELKFHIDFERLIIKISNQFITLPTAEIDDALQRGLEEIGRFAAADRSYIFLAGEDGLMVDNTHEWCAAGIENPRSTGSRGSVFGIFPGFWKD